MTNKTLIGGVVALVLVAGLAYWAAAQGMFTSSVSAAQRFCAQQGGNPDTFEYNGQPVEVCHLQEGEICDATALMNDNVCVPMSSTGSPDDVADEDIPSSAPVQIESIVRAHAAAELGVSEEEVVVITSSPYDWSDSCLGLGGPAESCAAVITPGYQVVVEVGSEVHYYRTDAEGMVIREDIPLVE